MTLTQRIEARKPVPPPLPEWRRRMLEGKSESQRHLARKDTTRQ